MRRNDGLYGFEFVGGIATHVYFSDIFRWCSGWRASTRVIGY